jgi:Domain of unknown function (DUF4824)
MIAWSARRTLVAGVALIALTNAVALAGVAWNRRGEPEAVLRLTERELKGAAEYGFQKENSGLALRLAWRLPWVPRPNQSDYLDFGYSANGGEAPWLGKDRLAELGFDVSPPRKSRRDDRQLPKEVLLVLEYDGPAWQAALERAEQRVNRTRSAAEASPGNQQLAAQADNAAKQLVEERQSYSRVFVIDSGRDLAALRARYPDRARYAIAHGRISIRFTSAGPSGYVNELSIPAINVPLEYRGTVDRQKRYEVGLAFGRRLEPWLTSAAPRP